MDVPLLGARKSRADILFPKARMAVMVDGCFWHRCPEHGPAPRENEAWWKHKLDANVARDRRTDTQLTALGWRVVRIWEHESPAVAADQIEALVRAKTG